VTGPRAVLSALNLGGYSCFFGLDPNPSRL